MDNFDPNNPPSRFEQKIAVDSYGDYITMMENLQSPEQELHFTESGSTIKIPLLALKHLGRILKAIAQGKAVYLLPLNKLITTQVAAEILGCSRPHLIKLLNDGQINFVTIGKHRKLSLSDVQQYRMKMKTLQKQHLSDVMRGDEELGLYEGQ